MSKQHPIDFSGLMIDWLTVRGPLTHRAFGDQHRKREWNGKRVEYRYQDKLVFDEETAAGGTLIARPFVGSWGPVRGGVASEFAFSCNPLLLLQRHNVFGSRDPLALAYECLLKFIVKLGLNVEEADLKRWRHGHVSLSRVDITGNYRAEEHLIPLLIDAVDEHVKGGKKRALETAILLSAAGYRRSKHYELSIYGKLLECRRAIRDYFPPELARRLLAAAKNSLRLEARWLGDGLKARGLDRLSNWEPSDVEQLFCEVVDKKQLAYAIQPMLSRHELEQLTPAQIRAYLLYLHGERLPRLYQAGSLNNLAKAIREKVNVNIRSHRRPQREPGITFAEILQQGPKPVPSWARELKLYHEPTALKQRLGNLWLKAQRATQSKPDDEADD